MSAAGSNPQGECLVLGGKGFVGRAVTAEARRRGWNVAAVGREDYDRFKGRACDLLINANGNSKKYLSRQQPARDFDASVRSVMRSLEDFSAARYVYLSSIDVYPDVAHPEHNRETEALDIEAQSNYGFHKFLAEQVVRHVAPRRLVLRLAGFVGEGLWKNSVYDLLTGRPLRVSPRSAYQYLDTRAAAAILFDLIESEQENEVFNVAGDGVVTLEEIAGWIPGCTLEVASDAPEEYYEINIEKLKARRPVPSTRQTVRRFVEDVLAGRLALNTEAAAS